MADGITNAEKAFNEGQEAYRKGLSSYDCPYHVEGIAYRYWQKGWYTMYTEEVETAGERNASISE